MSRYLLPYSSRSARPSLGSTSLLAAVSAWRTEDRHEIPSHAPVVRSQPSHPRGACRRRWRRPGPRQPARPRPRRRCHAERRPGRVPVGNPRRSGQPAREPLPPRRRPGRVHLGGGRRQRPVPDLRPGRQPARGRGAPRAPARGSSTSPRSAGAATTRGRSPSPRTAPSTSPIPATTASRSSARTGAS